jgi:LysM repeat protein
MKSDAPKMVASRVKEMTVHYTGAKRVTRGKDKIASYIKATERYHMGRSPNMSGIGYNFAIDKWGRIWELRGWTYKNAANGTSSNSTSFSVNCLVGVEDNEPTPEMVQALQWLYAEAVRRFGRTLDVKGHQEHKPTACPGGAMMALIRSGRIQQAAPAPAPEPPAPPAPAGGTYTVVRGDSWWGIAKKVLGNGARWRELADFNGAPKTLYPGQVLNIPGGDTPPPPAGERSYTVVTGDSYWRISARTLGKGQRWREISDMNGGVALKPGMTLRIPGR